MTLTNRSAILGGNAARGAALLVLSGILTYTLPAPPGAWLTNAECLAYRQSCPLTVTGEVEPVCLAARDACSRLADVLDASSGLLVPPRVGNTTCRPTSFVQPWCVVAHPSDSTLAAAS